MIISIVIFSHIQFKKTHVIINMKDILWKLVCEELDNTVNLPVTH